MPNIISLQFFIPELILSATSILLIVCSFFKRFSAKDAAPAIAIFGLLLSTLFSILQYNLGTPPIFWGMLIVDKPLVFFKALFAVTAIMIAMFSRRSAELGHDMPEYYALLTGSVLGMNLLAGSNNLLMIYLSLEFVSLVSYILVGYTKGSARASEAALKYVLYGAVASGIFLFGSSLYYGSTGTLDIGNVSSLLAPHSKLPPVIGLFILAGFLYKIAAVPMQAWCPDAYEGAPTPVTAFLSVAPKAAGFAILMRVSAGLGTEFGWTLVIAVISAVTMTFGNLAAIPQNNLKRLLAYSSIAHAGYLLMGVACATQKGYEAVYFYFIAYLIMNLGAFLVVQMVANKFGSEDIETYKGLGRRGPFGAAVGVAMTIFLLSLTGVPPFVGFIGKFYIFAAVIDAKLYWLAIIGIVNSVISLYYYMRVVKVMFFDDATEQVPFRMEAKSLGIIMISLTILTVALGIFWQPLSTLVSDLIH